MTAAERIRRRNTAFVQIATAIACLMVAAFFLYVDSLPGDLVGLPGALISLGLLAFWMFRRGQRGLQRLAAPIA